MERLEQRLGREQEIDGLNRTLRDFVQSEQATMVGAMHITCSDESERETASSFQHWFADSLLPKLKFSSRPVFQIANLGGRYEWGASAIAEDHFSTKETGDGSKLLVVKVNSHVAVDGSHGSPTFGSRNRYGLQSLFCGFLHALLNVENVPAMDQAHEVFSSEGLSRLDLLRNSAQVEPKFRSLLIAVVNARLQARSAAIDIQRHESASPTCYLIVPCVTLNRAQRDTELVVGYYLANYRGVREFRYHGLGDDPSKYDVSMDHNRICITDDGLQQPRSARNHGEEILDLWIKRRQQAELTITDERFHKLSQQVAGKKYLDPNVAKEMAKAMGWMMLDLSPVPTAVLLVARGLVGVHHVYQAQRLARGENDLVGAKKIVTDFLRNIDSLSPEEARAMVDAVVEHHPSSPRV